MFFLRQRILRNELRPTNCLARQTDTAMICALENADIFKIENVLCRRQVLRHRHSSGVGWHAGVTIQT